MLPELTLFTSQLANHRSSREAECYMDPLTLREGASRGPVWDPEPSKIGYIPLIPQMGPTTVIAHSSHGWQCLG